MALAAAQVVDALAARIAPLAALGGRVYTSRAWPLAADALPACRVTAENEDIELVTLDGLTNQHRLEVAARFYAAAVDNLDDVLHALAAGAQALLFAPTPPYALRITGIRRELASDGQATLGVVKLQLSTTFFVQASAPETIL